MRQIAGEFVEKKKTKKQKTKKIKMIRKKSERKFKIKERASRARKWHDGVVLYFVYI